jgi:hypothetical protein
MLKLKKYYIYKEGLPKKTMSRSSPSLLPLPSWSLGLSLFLISIKRRGDFHCALDLL